MSPIQLSFGAKGEQRRYVRLGTQRMVAALVACPNALQWRVE